MSDRVDHDNDRGLATERIQQQASLQDKVSSLSTHPRGQSSQTSLELVGHIESVVEDGNAAVREEC